MSQIRSSIYEEDIEICAECAKNSPFGGAYGKGRLDLNHIQVGYRCKRCSLLFCRELLARKYKTRGGVCGGCATKRDREIGALDVIESLGRNAAPAECLADAVMKWLDIKDE